MTVLRVILLITFSALMIWLWSPMFNASETNKKSDDEPLAKPDYVATALEQTTYSENGLLNYHVTADKMELYQDLGFSHFAKPIFTLYNGEQKLADKCIGSHIIREQHPDFRRGCFSKKPHTRRNDQYYQCRQCQG